MFLSIIQKELRLERYNHEKEKYSKGIYPELIEINIGNSDNNCSRFASYKISYMVLSNNSENVGTSSNEIKDIVEEAQTDEISKILYM